MGSSAQVGSGVQVPEGSGRFPKVPVQGQVQVAGARSARFLKVVEGCRRFLRCRARHRLQVYAGSESSRRIGRVPMQGRVREGRFRRVLQGFGGFCKLLQGFGRFGKMYMTNRKNILNIRR